jgi:quinol monooxygenase YgiN
MKASAQRSRAEDGCKQFHLMLPNNDPKHTVVIEKWRDEATHSAHLNGPSFAKARDASNEWIVDRKVTSGITERNHDCDSRLGGYDKAIYQHRTWGLGLQGCDAPHDPRALEKLAAKALRDRIAQPLPKYVRLHYLAPSPSRAMGSALSDAMSSGSPQPQHRSESALRSEWQRIPLHIQRFAPAPAPIRVPISCRDAQRPYRSTRPHHICVEPSRLCGLIGVRDITIPAFRSPKLAWAPGVTSGLEEIFLLDGGISRPQPPCRQSRVFQESPQYQPSCAGKRLRQRMEGSGDLRDLGGNRNSQDLRTQSQRL